jgi:uncharacterized protein YndB with AHSA1/START domain
MNGELEQIGDQWRLRFTRRLRHPAEKVWRAITEPEHLEVWFPQKVIGEWTPGASLRFAFDGSEIPDFDGEVLACDPPTLLEYRWGTDTLRFEILPEGAACTLTLLDTIDELGKAARDAAGWHSCLDVVEYELDGSRPPWTSSERWREVHTGYVARFGPAASVIGPPEAMTAGTEKSES